MEYLKHAFPRDKNEESNLENKVHTIIENVRISGDDALIQYNTQFDGNTRKVLKVSKEEIKQAYRLTDIQLAEDLKETARNLTNFAKKQKQSLRPFEKYEISPGIFLGQKIIPVESCCCYIPGGGYPLYSTALMLGITAKIAGVKRIAMCTPTVNGTESIHPSTLVAMDLAGVEEIYAVSGAHAIAAFTYGTKQIAPVDLIVGPGNQFVTEAKRQCYGKIGIDFLAGPSEILILADETGDAVSIAADIISESEHDQQAIARLITTDRKLGIEVMNQVGLQLQQIDGEEIAEFSWKHQGEIILADSIEEGCRLADEFAPEHLVLQVTDSSYASSMVHNYGSLFLGRYSAVVYSDYVNGINHTLPTSKSSRYTGGVWIGTFSKVCTVQEVTKEGAQNMGRLAERLAEGEGFLGHAHAAKIRIN